MISNVNFDNSQHDIRSINHQLHREDRSQSKEDILNHDHRSQKIKKSSIHPQLDNLKYKKQLLRLMVRVKFQKLGFREDYVTKLIDKHLEQQKELNEIDNIHIHDLATEIFLNVFSDIIGERHLLQKLPSLQRSEDNQRRIESEREDQMGERRPRGQMQEQDRAERLPIGPAILCNICYNTSTHNVQESCQHAFCLDCMRGYLRQNLRSDNYFIKCPQWECREQVAISTIKSILSKDQFKRFIYFRQKNQKELDPDNTFCPKPDCGQVLVNSNNRFSCPKCHSDFCEICMQPYHGQQKCNTVLKQVLEKTYKNFSIKKCPGCRSPIEKSDGCNHMTCKKCQFQFCWICEKKYSKHHYRYYNCFGCPGMMFQDQDQILAERFKQCCLYLLLPFVLAVILLVYAIAVPVFMVGCLLFKPCIWSQENPQYCEHQIANFVCCSSECFLKRLFIWLLLQPRAIFFSIFVAPVKLTLMFCSSVCEVFD